MVGSTSASTTVRASVGAGKEALGNGSTDDPRSLTCAAPDGDEIPRAVSAFSSPEAAKKALDAHAGSVAASSALQPVRRCPVSVEGEQAVGGIRLVATDSDAAPLIWARASCSDDGLFSRRGPRRGPRRSSAPPLTKDGAKTAREANGRPGEREAAK